MIRSHLEYIEALGVYETLANLCIGHDCSSKLEALMSDILYYERNNRNEAE